MTPSASSEETTVDTKHSQAALQNDEAPKRVDAGADPTASESDDTHLNREDGGAGVADPESDPPVLPAADAGHLGVPVNAAALAFDAGVVAPKAKNVILLIADGYGATAIDATRRFVNGNSAPLAFETLPHQAWVSTNNAHNQVTESAAAATAMATGHKVDEAVISVALPGDGADLKTALEVQRDRGKRTAIVTTHTEITDATPAAFAGHAANRSSSSEIVATYLSETRPNVMFGFSGPSASEAQVAGYTVVETAEQLAALDLDVEHHVSGQFTESTVPPLKDMALVALDILEDSPEGFFAVIENEETDSANHSNDLPRMLAGAVEFHEAVAAVMAWAKGRDDTLIIVGTDHETGGLQLAEGVSAAGVVPAHTYTTSGHTGADVRFFAGGVGAAELTGRMENTDLFALLAGYDVTSCSKGTACYAATVDVVLRESDPNTAYSQGVTLEGDQAVGATEQSLLRFGNLAGYLPAGCTLEAAKLILHGSNGSASGVNLHRMLTEWSPESTWSSFGGNGVQTDDIEAAAAPDARSDAFLVGVNTFDVTAAVKAWLAEPNTNHGWVVVAPSSDGLDLGASESSRPPELRLYCD